MAWNHEEPRPIRLARMMAMSPEAVYSELQEYNKSLLEAGWLEDKELEQALLSRNHPLINLGLAQFGSAKEVVSALYNWQAGDEATRLALRLAVLSNPVPPRGVFFGGSFGVIGEDEIRRILNDGTDEEIRAMFLNVSAKRLISKLYSRKPPFDALPEGKFLGFAVLASENPCIRQDDSNEGGPDLQLWDIQNGVLTLLETAPANEGVLDLIYRVVSNLNPAQAKHPDKNPLPLIERWRAVVVSDRYEKHFEYMGMTELPFKEEFCCLLAAIYGEYWVDQKAVCIGDLNSSDVIRRCAFYGTQKMTAGQMQEAHNRDGNVFTLAALCNDSLFYNRETRLKLEDFLGGDLFFRYRKRCEQLKARWPNFEMGPIGENAKDIWADDLPRASDEKNSLERLEEHLNAIQARVAGLYGAGQWALLGIVAILVLLLWRRHT